MHVSLINVIGTEKFLFIVPFITFITFHIHSFRKGLYIFFSVFGVSMINENMQKNRIDGADSFYSAHSYSTALGLT